MKSLFKISNPTMVLISSAFKSINKFKTNDQKILGFSQIIEKMNGLLIIRLSKLNDLQVITDKKRKTEQDILSLSKKLDLEINKNIDILSSSENCKSLVLTYKKLFNEYGTILC